ncbi:adhesive plaque matrix protein, partial [Biomphalaria glabrata]
VKSALQQSGYRRIKRGYKDVKQLLESHKLAAPLKAKPTLPSIKDDVSKVSEPKLKLPNDPDFAKQWYL